MEMDDTLIADTLGEIINILDDYSEKPKYELYEKTLHTVACKKALKGGKHLTDDDMESLVSMVMELEGINTCPHGRPICVRMSKKHWKSSLRELFENKLKKGGFSLIPIIAIVGATASGKSGFAVKIAKALDGEVVSADSMQIYKYMDIGTAKVTEEEKNGVPHHLIDVLEPDDDCNVSRFTQMAQDVIEDIHSRGKTPVICGGTGLYIDSLIKGASFSENSCDEEYRVYLENLVKENGADFLHKMLTECDEKSAQTIHPNNVKRVIRALEFFHVTGKSITIQKENTVNSKYAPVYIGMQRDRELLYQNIDLRVDAMVEAGLFKEVEGLIKKGYSPKCNSMQAIGYREVIWYFKGLCTNDEAIRLIKRNSRRYAKRQLTWFLANKDIVWVNPDDKTEVDKLISDLKSEK